MAEPRVLVGTTYGPIDAVIDADHARAYARATNDLNPAYLDEGVVPPVFTVSLILGMLHQAHAASMPAGAVRGARGGVHGEHDLYLHRPLMAGEHVTAKADTYTAQVTPAGCLVSQHFVFTDDAGEAVVEHYWTTFMMGGVLDPAGPPLADHSFPDAARADPLGTYSIHVDDDQSFRYAGASTDHAAMHVHDGPAVQMGFPSKFMQGLCTFAMCSQAVIHLAAGGDPRPLSRLAVRFSSPVFPRNDVEVSAYDAGLGDDGRRLVAFEAESAGVAVIKHGRAEFRN